MEVYAFGSQPVYRVKYEVLQLNAREQDRSVTALAMKAITPGMRLRHFSTTRATEKGVLTLFLAETWLVIGKAKIPLLRKRLDRYKVHLDATITERSTDYLSNQLAKFDGKDEHGSAC